MNPWENDNDESRLVRDSTVEFLATVLDYSKDDLHNFYDFHSLSGAADHPLLALLHTISSTAPSPPSRDIEQVLDIMRPRFPSLERGSVETLLKCVGRGDIDSAILLLDHIVEAEDEVKTEMFFSEEHGLHVGSIELLPFDPVSTPEVSRKGPQDHFRTKEDEWTVVLSRRPKSVAPLLAATPVSATGSDDWAAYQDKKAEASACFAERKSLMESKKPVHWRANAEREKKIEELLQEGRAFNEEAARIWADMERRKKGDFIVDLHGAVAEGAMQRVISSLIEWWNTTTEHGTARKPLKIITGLGNRSPKAVPVLLPKVVKLLDGQGWQWRWDGEPRGGRFGAIAVVDKKRRS